MKEKKYTLEDFRGRDPFRVPEGYFEGFTEALMSRIPDIKSQPKGVTISLYDRIKPWLYMAAAFVGIIILFNVFNKPSSTSPVETASGYETPRTAAATADEDEEFMQYIKDMYMDKYALSYTEDIYYY
jgi:hypothetical protein